MKEEQKAIQEYYAKRDEVMADLERTRKLIADLKEHAAQVRTTPGRMSLMRMSLTSLEDQWKIMQKNANRVSLSGLKERVHFFKEKAEQKEKSSVSMTQKTPAPK